MEINTDPLAADDGPVFIDRDTCCDGRFGDAVIDEVAIFNVALSADEIQMMMEKGLSAMLLTPVEPEGKLSTTWGNVKKTVLILFGGRAMLSVCPPVLQ